LPAIQKYNEAQNASGGGQRAEGRGLFAGHRQLRNFHFIAALGLNFNDRFFLCTFTSSY